ncbi:MAG: SDR family oxidoreductase [Candidatus Electrothrix sp. YB6]
MVRQQNQAKLLITGVSGVLGWALGGLAARSWETFGTVFQHPVECPGVHICRADLTDERSLGDLFTAVRPDAVVHAAALSSPECCQRYPDTSEAINVTASANIASLCADLAIPCVFTSSDLVFDGKNPPYDENCTANPISIYGEHKLRAETAMQSRYPSTTVCRLPLLLGLGSPATDGLLKGMLKAMENQEELRLFTDEIRTPVTTETAAHGILLALRKAEAGTLHLGGPERLSRWELGQAVAEVFQFDSTRLVQCRQQDAVMEAPRPRDVSLDSAKTAAIGYLPRSIREQLCFLRTKMRGTLPA